MNRRRKQKTTALVLFSGGLDSILAAKILRAQDIDAMPVCFESYFFSAAKARQATAAAGLDLRVEDISKSHLAVVKNPRYGRGAAMNPCIDCHLLMLKTAGEIMGREGFDFVATGEVVGQRPMSQTRRSLEIIDRQSGLAGKILRPLSAKLLAPIEAEINGLVNRDGLYGLSGRSRRGQLALAKKFGIKDIPQPGGGCVLTDAEYARRLKELMANCPNFDGADARLLRYGRAIWQDGRLVMIARDQKECQNLKVMARRGDWLFEPQNFSGPTVLIRNFGKKIGQGETLASLGEIKKMGQDFVRRYSKKVPSYPDILITDQQ